MFPTALMPELITTESSNKVGISKIFSIIYVMNKVSVVLSCIGLFIASIPLVFITIGILMRSAARIIKQQSHIQYRYQGFSAHMENS